MSLHITDPFKDMKQESEPTVTEEIIPTDQPPPRLPQTVMLSPMFPHQESCHSDQTQMLAVKTLSCLSQVYSHLLTANFLGSKLVLNINSYIYIYSVSYFRWSEPTPIWL